MAALNRRRVLAMLGTAGAYLASDMHFAALSANLGETPYRMG
jgi:hypothetical protein